jgi:predicted Abi (CAAX) family protease
VKNLNVIVLGGLMTCLSAIFQILPVFLSEAAVIITVFSSVPIYIIARINPKVGFLAVAASFFLVSFFSLHEAGLFLFTNAPVGFSLGFFNYHTQRTSIIILMSSIILTFSLCILNFLIGIPVFGIPIPGETMSLQVSFILVFSIIYNFLFCKLCNSIYKRLGK